MVSVTVYVKGLDPISFDCEQDHPILRQMCCALACRNSAEDQVLNIATTADGDGDEFIYFLRSDLLGLSTDTELDKQLFLDANKPDISKFAHLDITAEWKQWGLENIQRGVSKQEIFDMMLGQGFAKAALAELLDFEPEDNVDIVKRSDAETILPLLAPEILKPHRVASEHVELYLIENFLDADECGKFEKYAGLEFSRSTVVATEHISEHRTSETHAFSHNNPEQPLVETLRNRLSKLLAQDVRNFEALQCQAYISSQQYKAHHDYFSDQIPPYETIEGKIRTNQRQWSVLVYLRDAEPGSGTHFPLINTELTPNAGTAIIWNNLYPSGNPNPYSLHAGLPAGEKKKLILTQWIRQD